MAPAASSLSRSSSPSPHQSRHCLTSVPDEVLLHILSFLDVPELLNTSRTTHHLRQLSLDPLLHSARLSRASLTIQRSISCRPPLSALIQHRIYISRTSLAARNLNRNLIKIKLNKLLKNRTSPLRLVEQGVLPDEYVRGRVAPTLIGTKRKIEKERVKDLLRGWVSEWRLKAEQRDVVEREKRPDVRVLVRRFGRERKDGGYAKGAAGREEPARAVVLGLRRFWEGKGKEDLSG